VQVRLVRFLRRLAQSKNSSIGYIQDGESRKAEAEAEAEAVSLLRQLVAGFPPRRPWFEPWSGHMGFVVDKVALGQVFSEYFDFPYQFSFHRLLHLSSIIWGWYNRPVSGRRIKWTQSHPTQRTRTRKMAQAEPCDIVIGYREVPNSNLGPKTGYALRASSWFLSVPPLKFCDVLTLFAWN
jgi:hypothetical protein